MGSMNIMSGIMSMVMTDRAIGRFDKDSSDSLDKGEFRKMMTKMGGIGGLLGSNAAFKRADADGDGEVDGGELQAFMQKLSGGNNKRQAKKELENFLKMLGMDPNALQGKNLAELQKMLNEIMKDDKYPEDFNTPSNCGSGTPQSGGGSCGGGVPAPQGGGCNPASAAYCPPAPINNDAGGGNSREIVARGFDVKSDLKSSDANSDGQLNRAEFGVAMDNLNDRAADAGSKSFLNEAEKTNLFNRFDKNGDGQLSKREQAKLNNYITSGNQNNFLDNKLTVGDWNKLNNAVPNSNVANLQA